MVLTKLSSFTQFAAIRPLNRTLDDERGQFQFYGDGSMRAVGMIMVVGGIGIIIAKFAGVFQSNIPLIGTAFIVAGRMIMRSSE